jgi:hypothetical protein
MERMVYLYYRYDFMVGLLIDVVIMGGIGEE